MNIEHYFLIGIALFCILVLWITFKNGKKIKVLIDSCDPQTEEITKMKNTYNFKHPSGGVIQNDDGNTKQFTREEAIHYALLHPKQYIKAVYGEKCWRFAEDYNFGKR
jgi:hypothetical protein